ncbi:MAG: hypothetical protein ACK5U7_15115 [Bacteroidota bacterium]|jgi:hypothetical protein
MSKSVPLIIVLYRSTDMSDTTTSGDPSGGCPLADTHVATITIPAEPVMAHPVDTAEALVARLHLLFCENESDQLYFQITQQPQWWDEIRTRLIDPVFENRPFTPLYPTSDPDDDVDPEILDAANNHGQRPLSPDERAAFDEHLDFTKPDRFNYDWSGAD